MKYVKHGRFNKNVENKKGREKKQNNKRELGKVGGVKIMLSKPTDIYDVIMSKTDFTDEDSYND